MKRLFLALPFLLIGCQPCFALQIDHRALKEAIYQAEGGRKTKHPYGVLSVKCSGKTECGRIVDRSIRNSLKRYRKQGFSGDYRHFIAFFGNRWAPTTPKLKNDPSRLNLNWTRNTIALYEKNVATGI